MFMLDCGALIRVSEIECICREQENLETYSVCMRSKRVFCVSKEEKERLVDFIKKREAGAADSLSNLCRHLQKLQQEITNLPSRMPRTVRMHI